MEEGLSVMKSMLFYNPSDKNCKIIEKRLEEKHLQYDLLDATSRGISPYLYRDFRITKLPALYTLSRNKYKIYEGCRKIEAYLSKLR